MVETIDGGWGSLKDDGTWTGMIGMILRDEVDIAISDFYVTAERSMVIDYSQKIVELMYVLSHTLPLQNLVYFTDKFNSRICLHNLARKVLLFSI